MRYSRLCWCFSLVFGLMFFAPAEGESLFKKYNSDIGKYEFAKSYIIGLGYYSRVSGRLAREDVDLSKGISAERSPKMIQMLIDGRTLDNTEIRIARNYLGKYKTSPNGLIRQVAIDAMAAYDRLLEISTRERELWLALARVKTSGGGQDLKEEDILHQQVGLAGQKKEVAKDLIKASLRLRVVLLSAAQCENEQCKKLALTREERNKLVDKLDVFARDVIDWGTKAGQTTLQACIASIREVLEDPLYASMP